MDRILISGIRELGVHGVLPEEQLRPQPFEIDVELLVDVAAAGESDALEDTVDYSDVCDAVSRVVSSERYQLLERLASRIVEVCNALRNDSETPFNYLSDLTCAHYPDQREAPFEVIYNLYSIPANERVRLKVATNGEGVDSVTGVWPSADWPEREVYDLFGVVFRNHPDLRRILLPPDWEGHPLRKDYPLEFVENRWTENHLPEFTEVQKEQLEQRRAYGLEILSVPQEREVREIFKGGKEVMPKDK